MALFIVATPIGDPADLSLRARKILQDCAVVIGEEFRQASTLLKSLGITGKKLELLNEHTGPDELQSLARMCQDQDAALISDCGTPGFCDPGADLVAACRAAGIRVRSVPGPSSLMAFLSLCGQDLTEFYFRGFLPANREDRERALKQLKSEARPVILMDTPYRLGRLLMDLSKSFPGRAVTVGMDLSTSEELVLTGGLEELSSKLKDKKAEFILLLHEAQSLPRKKSRKK